MSSLEGKTIVITGASRGIGREIALRCAKDKANLVLAAKTKEPHPKLKGTIESVKQEVEKLGAKALAYQIDLRNEENIPQLMDAANNTFGGIDILINNASALHLTSTLNTEMKKFDLIFQVNVRATFACSKYAIPYLKQSDNPHILNLSPPLKMDPKWFKDHLAYTMSKYGMSMCTLGMSEEFKQNRIAVNSLWPKTTIATAAVEFNLPKKVLEASRKPEIMADAAYGIITKPSTEVTGNFFIDEDFLANEGVSDFEKYAINPGIPLFRDLYVD